MRTPRLFAIALAALLFPAVPALSQDRDATATERQRVVSHLTSLGYSEVRDVDVVGGTFEADARSPEGRDVDVILDRATLAVVRVQRS